MFTDVGMPIWRSLQRLARVGAGGILPRWSCRANVRARCPIPAGKRGLHRYLAQLVVPALGLGQCALVQTNHLVFLPGVPVGSGKVVAGTDGLGMVWAQDPLTVGEGALK